MELIRKYILDDHQTNREDLLYELDKLRHLNPKGTQRTNVGGWHRDDLISNSKFDALNKSIVVPFINEKMEEKGLNFLYEIFEEKIKAAMKKAL